MYKLGVLALVGLATVAPVVVNGAVDGESSNAEQGTGSSPSGSAKTKTETSKKKPTSVKRKSLSVDECQKIGFTPKSLSCGTCGAFKKEYSGDEESEALTEMKQTLFDECISCCARVPSQKDLPFVSAKVRFDHRYSGSSFSTFVERLVEKDFAGLLESSHTGRSPELVMKDSEGNHETVAIGTWSVDAIHEYLINRL